MKTLSQKRADGRARQRRHREYLAAGIAIARVKVGPKVQEMLIRGWMPENWTEDELNAAVSDYLKASADGRPLTATMSVSPPKADIPDRLVNVR